MDFNNNQDEIKVSMKQKLKGIFNKSYNKRFRDLKVKYKKDPKKKLVLVIAILGLFSMLVGSSYAYLSYVSKTANTTKISAGTLALELKNEANVISMDGALPVSDEMGLREGKEYSFDLENTGTITNNYVISIKNTCEVGTNKTINGISNNVDKCIPDKYIKIGLKEGDKSYKVIEYKTQNNKYILNAGSLNPKEKKSYKMKIWLDYDTPNDYNSKGGKNIIYSGKLEVDYEQGNKQTTDKTYVISYDANGGAGTMQDSTYPYNTTSTLRKNTFTREGYTFLGWSEDKDAGTPTYKDEDKATELTKATDNEKKVLYAVWKGNTRTVTINIANGKVSGDNTQSIEMDKKATFIVNPNKGYGGKLEVTCDNGVEVIVENGEITTSKIIKDTTCSGSYKANELIFKDESFEKNYSAQAQTIKLEEASNGTGEYTYTIESGNSNSYFSIANNILTIKGGTPEGSYKLVIKALDKNSNASKTKTVSIKITTTAPEITMGDKEVTYTGSAVTGKATSPSSGTFTYEYYNGGSCGGTKLTSAPINVGTYSVKAIQSASGNYGTGEKCAKITITKSDTTTSLTAKSATSYTGSAISANTATSKLSSNNSAISGASYTYEYYNGTSCSGTKLTSVPKDKGTYSVKAVLTATSNYNSSTSSCVTHEITAKTLTATAKASNKTYDGTTNANGTISLSGIVSGDTVTASGTCKFADKNVGTGKTVTCSSITLAGTDKGNYTVASTKATTANITAKSLTPTATVSNKTYDGTTNASGTISLSGAASGDTVTASGTCKFADKNVGTGKTVTCSSITLAGTDKGNYTVASTKATTANITAKAITITAKSQTLTQGSSIATGTGQVTVETLVSGDSLNSITLTPSTTAVTTSGTITPSVAKIVDSSSNDMTKNYQITYKTGTLVIKGKIYTVTYEKGSNVSTIGKTSDTCTTSGTSTSCSVTLPNITTNTGYTASGWYNGSTKAGNVGASYSVSGNTTLTANATANTYTINYYTYDGKTKLGSSSHRYNVSKELAGIGALNGKAPNEKVSFYGWAKSANSTERSYVNLESVKNLTSTNNGTINLYEIYRSDEVKITYKSGFNLATTTTTDAYYYYNDATGVSLITANLSTINKWNAVGWKTSRYDSSNSKADYDYNKLTSFSESVTLYGYYKRSYEAKFYSGLNKSKYTTLTSQTVYYNSGQSTLPTEVEVKTESSDNAEDISGWDKSGWRTDTLATKREEYFTNYMTVPFDTDFYCVYINSVLLNWYFKDDSFENGSMNIEHSDKVYLNTNSTVPSELVIPIVQDDISKKVKQGYTFGNAWRIGSEDGTEYAVGSNYKPNFAYNQFQAVNLYAVWKANSYSIGYTLNGGSYGTSHPTSGTYDSNINISNPKKTITITGNANSTGATVGSATSKAQTFAGWTADSNLSTSTAKYGTSTSVTNSWSSASTKVTAEYFKNLRTTSGTVTLTANWTPVAFNTPTITKTGYKCGWATSSSATSYTIASGGTYTPTATTGASVTLYGVCTANNYDVNLSIVNGTTTGDKTKQVSYNNTTTFTGLSANTGYGTPTVSCTNGQTATISGSTVTTGKITSDTTCTVTYAANTYQVKYNANGGTKEEFVDIFSGATITSDQEEYWKYNPTYNALQLGGQPGPEYAVIRTTEFEITDENSLLTFHAELSQGSLNYKIYNSNNEIVYDDADPANTFENPITIPSYHDKGKYTLEIELQTEGTAKVGNFTIVTPSSMSNSKHTYDTAKSLSKNIYTKTGYTFLGWSKDKNATTATYTDEESVKNLTGTNNETVNLYAIWKLKSKKITFETKYDTSSFSGPSTSNKTSEKISKTSTNLSYGSSEIIKLNPATPVDRYKVSVGCTSGINSTNAPSSGGGSSTSEYSYSIKVMNNSDTTTDSVCTITYTPKWEGVPTGYTAGATVTYAGKNWTVKSDNGEAIGLVLNETAGTGVYKSDVQSELNNDDVNKDVTGGGILPQSSNAYVTTDGGISTGLTSAEYWISSKSGYVKSFNIYNVTSTKYITGSRNERASVNNGNPKEHSINDTLNTSTYSSGIYSFDTGYFSVSSDGTVSIKNGSYSTSQTDNYYSERYAKFTLSTASKPSTSKLGVSIVNGTYSNGTYTDGSATTPQTIYRVNAKACGSDANAANHGKQVVYYKKSATQFLYGNQITGNGWRGTSFSTSKATTYAYNASDGGAWVGGYAGAATTSCSNKCASSGDCNGCSYSSSASSYARTYAFNNYLSNAYCSQKTEYSTQDVVKKLSYRPYIIVRER